MPLEELKERGFTGFLALSVVSFYMMKRIFWFLLFILSIHAFLSAEAVKPLIIYADGLGFTLIRAQKALYYDLKKQKILGLELTVGDQINLEEKSTLEIQLFPTLTVLKVSASTSFKIISLAEDGSCNFDVIYGRLRLKTDDKSLKTFFTLNGLLVKPATDTADLGFDRFITENTKAISSNLYCFQGKVAISAIKAAKGSGIVSSLQLSQQELASVFSDEEGGLNLVKANVSSDIKEFWQKNDFQSKPVKKTTEAVNEPAENKSLVQAETSSPLPSPAPTPTPALKQQGLLEGALYGYVDNFSGGLGERYKYEAVRDRNLQVNPDFTSVLKESTQTRPVPTTTVVEKKDNPPLSQTETKKTDTEVKPEEKKTEPPHQAPPQPGPSQPLVFVHLDYSFQVDYFLTPEPPSLPSMPGMEFLSYVFGFLMRIKLGLIFDFTVMFFDIIGVGVETGVMYNEVTGLDASFNISLTNYFALPVLFIIRLTLGPLYVQPQVGVVIPAVWAGDNFSFTEFYWEAGAKAGLRLGNLTLYGSVAITGPGIAELFGAYSELRVGGGMMTKIF